MEPVTISTAAGNLAAVVHLPDGLPASVVVCCHGLLSSKSSAKYILLCEELNRAGIAAVRFDFTGCGESEMVPAETLIDTRLRDLKAVLEYVCVQPWAGGRLGLMGSSFGGFISLLCAASGMFPVHTLVCWAAPFDLSEASVALEDLEYLRKLFPQGFRLGDPPSLEALPPVPRVLIIHGQQDAIVPWKAAGEIYRRVGEPRRLLLMEKADHVFLDPEHRKLAVKLTIDWFCEHGFSD
jgi:alpha-beta hydrolase superfamily lysophospholipase